MTPLSWPSIRSIARCVLPVLVGPSTAVTFRALKRRGRGDACMISSEMASGAEAIFQDMASVTTPCRPNCEKSLDRHASVQLRGRVDPRNESGTKAARIGNSPIAALRSSSAPQGLHRGAEQAHRLRACKRAVNGRAGVLRTAHSHSDRSRNKTSTNRLCPRLPGSVLTTSCGSRGRKNPAGSGDRPMGARQALALLCQIGTERLSALTACGTSSPPARPGRCAC